MLARTPLDQAALSAQALGISEEARYWLIVLHGMMLRGEVAYRPVRGMQAYLLERERPGVIDGFNMEFTRCGSVGCILGWTQAISGQPMLLAYPFQRPRALNGLFMMGEVDVDIDAAWRLNMRRADVRPEQAAQAIWNYLTGGHACWAEVLALEPLPAVA